MVDYAAVLSAIRPGAAWTLSDNDYSTLVWLEDSPKPTKKTCDDAWPQVEYELAYQQVEAERRARYQVETDGMFFAAQRDGTPLTAWQSAVDQIKADLPYPKAPK